MDSMSDQVPAPVNRVLKSLNIDDAVGVKCHRQADGHSCGYHSVCNLQVMHNLLEIGVDFKSLVGEINGEGVEKFIQDEKVWLKTQFNENFATKLKDARNANPKQEADLGEKTQEKYLSQFLEIVCSDEFNNLDKIKKIIQIEDEVKKITNDTSQTIISSLLEFERHYEAFISNFVGDLIHKCSSKGDPLFSDDGGPLIGV
jgi:hypothetical protein